MLQVNTGRELREAMPMSPGSQHSLAQEDSSGLWATLHRCQGMREANKNPGGIHEEVRELCSLDIPIRVTDEPLNWLCEWARIQSPTMKENRTATWH